MSELAIPDPRKQPVPTGWFEAVAAPPILQTEDWDALDNYEAQLRAFASYVDSFDGDALEFEKALRIVEKRRGDLLGDPIPGGDRRSEEFQVSRAKFEIEASAPTMNRWRAIAAHWDDLWPLVVRATERREVTQTALLRVVRKLERPNFEIPDATSGLFSVLYCDPPWRYDFVEADSRAIENQYPTLPLEEIKALEVPAADDAVLFMWATSPKLAQALEVIAAWGFEYRTSMVWVKDRIGMGYYVRQQHEPLLIAKRGKLPMPEESQRPSSVVQAPRGHHSAKPLAFYELIEHMYPDYPRVELFARTPRPNWVSWGNEISVAA